MRLTWKRVGVTGACVVALAVGLTVAAPQNGRARRPRTHLPIESTSQGEEVVAGRVLLRLQRPLPLDLVAALQHYGVGVEDRLDGGIDVLSVPPDLPPDLIARAFETLDEVEFCEPDGIVRCEAVTNDPDAGSQWHLDKIGVGSAWEVSEGSGNVTIAVIDTGIDIDHPDLTSKVAPGCNFVRNIANANDDHGHGTHVAGLAAAATDNNFGIAGVGFRCVLMPVKVLDSAGVGSYAAVAAGIRWASTHGAKVVNLSLGGSSPSSTLQASIDAAVGRGSLVIAAAGNSNSTSPQYPAYYANALAVGASTPTDSRAAFSNYGPWVDVAAPGTSLLSTFPLEPVTMGSYAGGFWPMSGTSMSTPVVSGVAGLLFAYLGTAATPAAVRSILESTANPVSTPWTAFGRIDAAAALERATHPFTPRTANVRNVGVTMGRYKAGDVTSLMAVDAASLELVSEGVRAPRQCEMEVDMSGLSGTLTALQLQVVSRSTVYSRQTISVYNWAAEAYEVLDSAGLRVRGGTRVVDLSNRAQAYVRDGLLRARVHFRAVVPFTGAVDAIRVSATGY